MKKTFLIFLIFALTCFAQKSIIIYDFKATGVDNSTVQAVHELFKSSLTERGFTAKDAPSGEICYDADCASKGASSAGTDLALFGSLSRLGEKIIVNVYVADASGITIHSDKLTSETVEDLDVVIERLSRGIAEGKKAVEVIDKTKITETEAKEQRRRTNFYTIGAKIGYRFPLGDSYGEEKMWQYEAVALYEMEKLFIEGRGYGCSGGDASAFGLGVGLYYIFTPKDFAPYLGGSVGIEWAMDFPYIVVEGDSEYIAGGASGDGPFVSAGGGLLMFQTYDFRVMLDVRYSAVFLGEADIEWFAPRNGSRKTDLGTQHSISVAIGITRKDIGGKRSSGICCMPW